MLMMQRISHILACGGHCVVLGAKLLHQVLVVHAAVLVIKVTVR
jgi:hypothetical protein